MKWIKASERLPAEPKNYFVKVWSVFHKYVYHDTNHFESGSWDKLDRNGDYVLEWLDESEDSEDAIAFVEWMRAYEYFDTITKDGKSVDIWVADNCRPHPQYTTAQLYQIFKSQR